MPTDSPSQSLSVRLYLDRHIKKQLAVDLTAQGYDVLRTEDVKMDTALDSEQLEFATKENRAILTFNIRDFATLHEQWSAAGQSHCGIIVSQQLTSKQYGLLLGRMLRLLNHFSNEEMRSNFVHLEQFK